MHWKAVAETEPVDLMATILGKRQLAEEALKYPEIFEQAAKMDVMAKLTG